MSALDFYIDPHSICIFSKEQCPYCVKAVQLIRSIYKIEPQIIDIGLMQNGREIARLLTIITKQTKVPNIFIFGKHIGGYSELEKIHKSGQLTTYLNSKSFYRCDMCGKDFDNKDYVCRCFPRQFEDWGAPL
jgi:glutaredoxin 3